MTDILKRCSFLSIKYATVCSSSSVWRLTDTPLLGEGLWHDTTRQDTEKTRHVWTTCESTNKQPANACLCLLKTRLIETTYWLTDSKATSHVVGASTRSLINHVCVWVCVGMNVCMYVCMYICMSVCLHLIHIAMTCLDWGLKGLASRIKGL